ncbi:MAG TPA: amino acid adenylation domain-containing protein [Pyrinomonadaceae bacterium]|nr:amino acid adenylation domain-containing protein [Pyrinomonadaceae bacterium]
MYEVVQGFRLSPQQRRLWQWQQENAAFRSWCVVRIEGLLNLSLLRRAVQSVISRHEVLRTFFHCPADVSLPLQRIADEGTPAWRVEDLAALTDAEQQARIEALVQLSEPFDFEHGPLLRLDCLQLSSHSHVLIVTLPPVCADSSTLRNLVQELSRCYTACRYESDGLPEVTQYVQFSEWQNELQDEDHEAGRNYWRSRLAGASLPATLPYERKTATGNGFASVTVALLPTGLSKDLLLACWQTLLWRLSGQQNVLVGVQFDGRKYEELTDALGLFAKCLPVQQDLAGEPRFSEVVTAVSELCGDADAWQEDFEWEECFPTNPDQNFFPVQFSFEDWPECEAAGDLRFSFTRHYSCIEPFKLKLRCVRSGDSLAAEFHFDTGYFAEEHVRLIARCFGKLVESVSADPSLRISDLDILSEPDRQQLAAWSKPAPADYPRQSMQQLFAAQAARTPAAAAVVYKDQSLSYAELDARANKLASYLRRRGVGPNSIVGLCVNRSLEMLVGLWGVLKAGGAYLPLDPEHPPARLAYQLSESASPVLLTQQSLLDLMPEFSGAVVCLDRDWQQFESESGEFDTESSLEDLAYVIFTSGSTGKPKGVQITHRSLVNYSSFIARTLRLDAEPLHFATVSTLSADLGNTCIFPSLISGGCLHVLDYEVTTDGDKFAEYLNEHPIDVLKIVPSHLNALLPSLELRDVFPRRYLILGGETLSFDLLERASKLSRDCRIVNHYGPTETTIGSLMFPVDQAHAAEAWAATVPIGRPIANTEIYLFDEQRRLVAPGSIGELHIGGAGLAQGYLKQPEQTQARFIQSPFSTDPAARLYRTGDLARYLPDGNVEFCGRVDHQVKIRGYRIELGEIENALREHSNIREAIVQARADEQGHKHLVAYCVAQHDPAPVSAELAKTLKQKLPAYMVPQIFINLKSLPLTRNGKVAREALPEPHFGSTAAERALPQTEAEKQLAAIWAEVLGVKDPGLHDNFFELGGDSVLSIQIIARARQAGLAISPKHVFDHPTIGALAQLAGTITAPAIKQGPVTGDAPLLPIQHWFFDRELPDPHHYNQAILLEVKQPLGISAVEQIARELMLHHDALRLRFVREGSGWRQFIAAPDDSPPLVAVDLSAAGDEELRAAIEAESAKLQTSFDLGAGPLVRVAYFDLGAERAPRLLLVLHHLVIDGVSWRILIEDLILAWTMAGREEQIELPARTTSFKTWAERLASHARAKEFQREASYWLADARQSVRPLPVDHADAENALAAAHTLAIKLDEKQTHALLHQVAEAYHTQINDLLLTALVQACARWSGDRSLLIDLEGHGREPLFDDVDVTRTAGWFTTHFPVLLRFEEKMSPGEALRSVKEQLRQIPNRGIGYGMLRYLSDETAIVEQLQSLPQPEVSFNYLGQLDQVLPPTAPFKLASEAVGETQSRRGTLSHLLRVNASVTGGELQVLWTYSRNTYEQATIEKLGQDYKQALESLIAECLSVQSASYTPSDFPDADLSQKDLDAIFASLRVSDVEDIYTLSPMQEGMLFQSLYNRDGDAYFRQMSLELHGELNLDAFQRAWRRVVEVHPALRTAFFWRGADRPVQVVQRNVSLPLEVYDWRDLAPELRQEKVPAYLDEQQAHAFDLEQAPLISLALIRLEDHVSRFVWSYHHILIDGWSRALIYKDVLAFYEAYCEGREAALEPRRPFRDYIRWLRRQDLVQAEVFWRERLQGFVLPPPLGPSEVAPVAGDFTKVSSRDLSSELTSALQTSARQHQLTLNTLVQGAWAVVLAQLTGVSDVVFGVVASGRTVDLPGSESMIGPFLNTLPLRIQLSPAEPALAWLRKIQQQQQELREFEHSPLAEIQRWSDVPRGKALFETVVNFTNYFVDSSLRRSNDRIEARAPIMVERVHYPMVLEAEPGPALKLLMLHDSRRFDEETIAGVLQQVESVLAKLAAGVDCRVSDLQTRTQSLPSLPSPVEQKQEHALSYHQQRLWFIDQFETGNVYESSPTYHNIPLILKLDGPIDCELLESSLNAIVDRHEALRTRIFTKDANTRQVVSLGETLKLNLVETPGENLLELALADSRRPFIIDEDHLVRATLIRGQSEESLLVVTLHHIIADRQSLPLIAEELAEIYSARSEERQPQLPEPVVQYSQYSEWQLGLGKIVLDPLLSYWKRQLGGGLRALELPEDRQRPAVHTYTAASAGFSLNKRCARRIEQLCLQERSTSFAVVLAVFKALLHRYANQDEIVVGTSAPCRNQPGTEDVVGPLANLLVLRSNVGANPAFRSFLAQVTKTVEQAYRHQEMPFDRLVLELNPEKDMSRTALFDVLFNFDTEEPGEFEFGETTARLVDTNLGYGKYDLNLLMRRSAQGLSGTVIYNSDIYDETKIEQMMRHFEVLLEAVIANPDRNLDDVVLLSEAEEQRQLVTWNSTTASYPEDKTIHQLFEIQAKRTPDNIAVVYGEASLTYHELDERANALAYRLQNHGVGPDVLVAVLLDKSVEMIVALLGILKAGGAYLPLNAEFPEERLRFMLDDSRTRHLVTSERLSSNITEWVENVVYVDRNEEEAARESRPGNASPGNIAYCIYTSGSTGKPKGVLVEHRNVVRLLLNDKLQFDFSESDVWTMFHSYSFDFSVWEMYGALLYGGKLVIVSEDQMKDPLLFLDLLTDQKVTVLNQTPSAFNNLAGEALKRPETNLVLRYVIFGGEELHPIQLKEWRAVYPNVKLVNMYGITETTVHVTFKEIAEHEIEENVSHIGVPIPTTTTYIFDSKLRLLPVGVPGEVCVGGLGVSRGYLDRDELTDQKFIANPYKPEERIYRSGDLAKLLPNGEMVYLGRLDDQVQIRGFRVEPGEVRSHLLEHPSVAKAEIVVRRNQSDTADLVAYVELSYEVNAAELRRHLAQTLPYYMVPSAFVILQTLPMTPNGKVDRKALPAPNASRETEISESRLTLIQEVVAGIWAEVLEIDRVTPADNFLELGGHSLMATRVFSRIREAFQVELPLKTLFDAPVLAELAGVIEKAMRTDSEAIDPPLVPAPRDRELPTTFGQHGLWLINRMEPHSHLYNLPFALRLKGSLDSAALERSLITLCERHESLRTTFKAHNGKPRQVISPAVNTELLRLDLRHLAETEREVEAHRLAVAEAQKPFDLERGPLLRTVLLQLDDEDYRLLFNMHHIITDGWSFEVLAREVGILYEAYSRGLTPTLPELPIQYADYAVWQRESLRGERLENQLGYWRRQLHGMQTLRLPGQRPEARTNLGASQNIQLSSSLAASLITLSRREGVTLFITLLAAFKVLLYRYSGQEDVAVGSPMTDRGRREVEGLIGYFVNMVPLRSDLSGNPTFRELLSRVRQTTLGAYAHKDVPLQTLLKELGVERETGRAIPFPAVFVLQNAPMSPLNLADVTISAVDIFKQTTPADLYLAATEFSDGISAGFKYSVDLFSDKMIAELLVNFTGVLETVVAQPECRLLEIPFREGTGANREASEKARAYQADQFAF